MADLIEAMARAIWEQQCGHWGHYRAALPELCAWEELTESKQRELIREATAAIAALRDTLEPVGHRYTNIADGSVTFTPNKWNMNRNYFVETPLYALPEIKP